MESKPATALKRISRPKLEKESYEEQFKAGRYNAATVLIYKGWRMSLKCGTRDSNVFWVEGSFVFVLTDNSRYHYAGLSRYELEECYVDSDTDYMTGKLRRGHNQKTVCECGDCFIKGDELPDEFFDWGDIKKFNYLAEYL